MKIKPYRPQSQKLEKQVKEESITKGPLTRTLVEYGGSTTLHGLPYILEDGRLLLERVLWVVLVTLCAILSFYWTYQIYKSWDESPILTTVGTTEYDIEQIEYPSITICTQGSVREIIESAAHYQYTEYFKSKGLIPDIKDSEQREAFLHDFYKGMKDMPNELVELMASPHPEKALNIRANLKTKIEPTEHSDNDNRDEESAGPTDPQGITDDCPNKIFSTDFRKNNLLHTYDKWGPYYKITLEIKLVQKPSSSELHNLIHMTSSDNNGARIPAVFLRGNVIAVYISNLADLPHEQFLYTMVLNQWHTVQLEQKKIGPQSAATVFEFSVDGIVQRSLETLNDQYKNVKLYHSNPWYLSAGLLDMVEVKNILIWNGADGCMTQKRHKREGRQQMENKSPPLGIVKLDYILNPQKAEDRKKSRSDARKKYNDKFGGFEFNNDAKLIEILWYTQLPCFDIQDITSNVSDNIAFLKRCYWKGKQISCSTMFKMQPTDRGMCCSFNMEAAEKGYKDSSYTESLRKLQTRDKELSFRSVNEDHEQIELEQIKPEAGLNKGLTVILDAHRDLISSGTVFDDFRGFVAKVNPKNEFPITSSGSFLIEPGKMTTVSINALSVEADDTTIDSIRSLAPAKRDCYFEDEFSLKIHRRYSKQNCFLECSLEYASNIITEKGRNFTKCIPWFYPIKNGLGVKMCDPWETKAFQKIMKTVPRTECNYCLPDCEGSIFEAKVTSAAFQRCDHTNLGASPFCNLETRDLNPTIWAEEARNLFAEADWAIPDYLLMDPNNKTIHSNKRYRQANKEERESFFFQGPDPTYNAFEKDIAMVKFYFEKNGVIQFQRKASNNWYNFMSQVGGNAGFGVGFSFISAMEIMYWLTIRLVQNYYAVGGKKENK